MENCGPNLPSGLHNSPGRYTATATATAACPEIRSESHTASRHFSRATISMMAALWKWMAGVCTYPQYQRWAKSADAKES